MKTALISVFDKTGIEQFVQALVRLGWQIISSGGTAKYLTEHGIPVRDVAEIVGEPILGHRVVTLSREIHAGLLARDCPEDQAELDRIGAPRIDLVCVDFYPLEAAIKKNGATAESVVESIDIGGPTMAVAGAKGDRIVVLDEGDRKLVLANLESGDSDIPSIMRRRLRAKAEFTVARYRSAAAKFYGEGLYDGLLWQMERPLAYGENRDQSPADLLSRKTDDLLALDRFEVVAGDPSYVGMADSDSGLEVLCRLADTFRLHAGSVPYIAIACKHGDPCGAAIDWSSPATAVYKMLHGDPTAVMGGEVITNFTITDELALRLHYAPQEGVGRDRWGLDMIVAPDFSDAAITTLEGRTVKPRRLLRNPQLLKPVSANEEWRWKPVRGGALRQKAPSFIFLPKKAVSVGQRQLTGVEIDSLILAQVICWCANSNSVTLAKDRMLIGRGFGQQDRIACVRLCLSQAARARHDAGVSVFASDAFFPFAESKQTQQELASELKAALSWNASIIPKLAHGAHPGSRITSLISKLESIDRREGPQLLVDAGCIGGVVPADGKNIKAVQDFFALAGLTVFYPDADHRGFAKH